MMVGDHAYRSIWRDEETGRVRIIDQTRLPHEFEVITLDSLDDAVRAISDMQVRGAPLIGATAAWGLALALAGKDDDHVLAAAHGALLASRPTAVNLRWALDRICRELATIAPGRRVTPAFAAAQRICDEDVMVNDAIGEHGLPLIRERFQRTGTTVNILTHCNAGWLATVDWGTALAPVYKAHDSGIPVHVWVDETRPRNQGASLTMWELMNHRVPCTLIVDNAGGHLMQCGRVDMVIVGSDRTASNGDVCNKIGTYLKALAAHDNGVPFYVALPCSTIDRTLDSGAAIPIEERDAREVLEVSGDCAGRTDTVSITCSGAHAMNPAFDVTPAKLVTGYITEQGCVTGL